MLGGFGLRRFSSYKGIQHDLTQYWELQCPPTDLCSVCNEGRALGCRSFRLWKSKQVPNQMDKKMDNEIEAGLVLGVHRAYNVMEA